MEEHYIGEVSEKQREIYISELADVLTKNGKKPYIIENGATTIHGSVGYIHLPLELAALGSEYSITDLFVPGGNGGLASGIVLGTMLLGNPFHVHVITVENSKEELHRIIKELVEGMKEYPWNRHRFTARLRYDNTRRLPGRRLGHSYERSRCHDSDCCKSGGNFPRASLYLQNCLGHVRSSEKGKNKNRRRLCPALRRLCRPV